MELDDLLEIGENERASRPPLEVRCCTATGCVSANSPAVLDCLKKVVKESGLSDRVRAVGVGCMRLCSQGPLVEVAPAGTFYQKVTTETAPSVVAGLNGGTVTAEPLDPRAPFFTRQASVVLENSGKIVSVR